MAIAAEAAGRDLYNRAGLARDARLDLFLSMAFTLPGLAVVAICVVIPCGWLFYLSAFGPDGNPTWDNYRRVFTGGGYLRVFLTTFQVSLATVAACVITGVPFATFINKLRQERARLFLAAILLPFWTSLLVRAYAWLVLLGRNGVVNTFLLSLGVTSDPLPLGYNQFATILGMTHIMLPVFLLPVLGAMREIDRTYMQAAAGFGAGRAFAYRTVFLPLALPGITAGAILVFVMSLGFYVTPAILGGGNVQVISMRIARSLTNFSNWGAASALGVLLLVATGLLFAVSYGLRHMILSRQRR